MSKLLYTILIAISLVLMACPYDSEVELCTYEEALKTDKKLQDIWVAFNEDGSRDEVLIEKGNKTVLFVSHKHYGENKKQEYLKKYRAYSTDISGVNLFTIEKDDNTYNYCKYAFTSKNELYIQFVDKTYMENNLKVDSVDTESIRTFLGEHVNKEDLYTNKMEFYRKYSPEYEKIKIFLRKSGF